MRVVATICAGNVAPQRWRNGGGWTRVLLTWPPGTDSWQLRISLATITAPGPFSAFPGVQRVLALVDGAGVLLNVNGQQHRLLADSAPLHFDGAAAAHAVPLDGPSTDLNLMTAAGSGELLRAARELPWSSALAQRGLYSAVAGQLHCGTGTGAATVATLAVPADSLTWLAEAADLPLCFVPTTAAPAMPAWWLGYAPPA